MTIQKITADPPESKSPDLAASNLAQLKALFPELVTEGKDGVVVNVDVLKQLVGDKVITDCEEKYGLHLKKDRSSEDILFELPLKLGLDLCVPIETKKFGEHEVHNIGAGSLLVCLSSAIPQAETEPLALGVAGLHKELHPAGESTVVFKDSAFANAVAKTNLSASLQQHDI